MRITVCRLRKCFVFKWGLVGVHWTDFTARVHPFTPPLSYNLHDQPTMFNGLQPWEVENRQNKGKKRETNVG
jgi:hypothetical protein